jgi:hypothetical protein
MIFHTRNSSYEVDLERKRIRRLSGHNRPTPRQGQDGVWKDFQRISELSVGAGVLIVWSEEGTIPSTFTSPIVKVIEKDVEPSN